MDKDSVKQRFKSLNVWKSGGQRAPHKPLLILYALGRYQQGKERLIPYSESAKDLKQMLADFGPPRRSHRPEYPFWHLKNDGIWELKNTENIAPHGPGKSPSAAELTGNNVCGGLKKEIYDAVRKDSKLLVEIAFMLLEAAHIKWHQAGGPDNEDNGIALCTMHHKLFDRGVFTLADDLVVLVSELAHGTTGFDDWLMAFHGKRIHCPQRQSYYPEAEFVTWHIREVFKGYARPFKDT